MRVEVLHIADCPNWQAVGADVRRVLDAIGMPEVEVTFRLIGTPEEARAAGFSGSPTILIDGQDAFPTTEQVTDLSCRVFPTPEGLRGAPTLGQLTEAVRAHSIPAP